MSIIKLNNKAVSNATAFGSITSLGSMTFIKKLTASSSATLSFVDGTDGVVLDDTYKEYVFTFKDIHPATNRAIFGFNLSTDSGSNYNVTKTTTAFIAFHSETNDADVALSYDTGFDLAQSTADQRLTQYISSDGDSSASGNMSLFNPASTTYVKHFISSCNNMVITSDLTEYFTMNQYVAGYGNTTSAVDAIRFQFSSGNIDAGDICLYGIA
jgi:hypothetical protein